MFVLELDLWLYFIPPMSDVGRGISLTRRFELPFPPTNGLSITGQTLNETPTALGFVLKDVTWDVDRSVFMAHTIVQECGFPIPFIPQTIRTWLDRGWVLGSFEETYECGEESESEEMETESIGDQEEDSWDAAEKWVATNPRLRSKEFNQVLRAVVREMALTFNNSATAYAIDQTKMFFSDEELKERDSPTKNRFIDALTQFGSMPEEQKSSWRDRVMRRYPKLAKLADEA